MVGVEAQPVDQPGVLHRDGGVRGQRLEQPHVVLAELRSGRRAGRRPPASRSTAGPERSGTTIGVLDAAPPAAPTQLRSPRAWARPRRSAGAHRQLPEQVGCRGAVEQPGVVDPGGQQHLGVAALRGQPQGRGVRRAAAPGPGRAGRRAACRRGRSRRCPGQLVQLGEAAVLAEEVRVRPVEHERGRSPARPAGALPMAGVQRQEHDQAEHNVDARSRRSPAPRTQELRELGDALQQHHDTRDGRQGDHVAGEHRGGEHQPGAGEPPSSSRTRRR